MALITQVTVSSSYDVTPLAGSPSPVSVTIAFALISFHQQLPNEKHRVLCFSVGLSCWSALDTMENRGDSFSLYR